MAVYDYQCPHCGPFSDLRPMAMSEQPNDCPHCGTASPRVILRAPHLSAVASPALRAQAVNERSAHEPRTGHVCGAGCAHQKPAAKGSGYKTFPGKRPWMVSH